MKSTGLTSVSRYLTPEEQLDENQQDEEIEEILEEQGIYGEYSKSKGQRVDELLTKLEVERLIPKRVIEETYDFSKPILEHETIEDIRRNYEINKTTDVSVLNSSVFIQTSLGFLEQLEQDGSLSNTQKQKIEDLKFLLERIGNIKINESDMLLKLMEND